MKWAKGRLCLSCRYKHGVNWEPPQLLLEWICMVNPEGNTTPAPAVCVMLIMILHGGVLCFYSILLLDVYKAMQPNSPFLFLGDFIDRHWYRLPKISGHDNIMDNLSSSSRYCFPVTCSSIVHTKAHYTQFLFAFSVYYMRLLNSWSKVRSWGSCETWGLVFQVLAWLRVKFSQKCLDIFKSL